MPRSFLRISSQVAQLLKQEIADGTWREELPGEQALAGKYQVSRKTVRSALTELRSAGIIHTRNGIGSRVVPNKLPRPAGKSSRRIGLLLPDSLYSVRQYTLLWINHLTEALYDAGYQLEVSHGRKYFGAKAGRSLAKLTGSKPAACWILARSNRAIQAWFSRSPHLAVIAGTAYPETTLPSVDVDHHALCRHAAHSLLRAGHRRIAIMFDGSGQAGDWESEEGFLAALGAAPTEVASHICRIERSSLAVKKELRRLMTLPEPPTAFVLSNSFSYLTAASYLASLGKRIPEDISLISRDHEPFLEHLHPLPSRYYYSPLKFARAMFRALEEAMRQRKKFLSRVRDMPDFLSGDSVAAPAGGPSKPRARPLNARSPTD